MLYSCPQANKKFSCLLFTRVRAAWRRQRWQQVRGPERWGSLRGHPTLEWQPSGQPPDGGGYLSVSS